MVNTSVLAFTGSRAMEVVLAFIGSRAMEKQWRNKRRRCCRLLERMERAEVRTGGRFSVVPS